MLLVPELVTGLRSMQLMHVRMFPCMRAVRRAVPKLTGSKLLNRAACCHVV